MNLKKNPADKEWLDAEVAKLYRGKPNDDEELAHMINFFDCVKDRSLPISDVYSHCNSVNACHMANIAMLLGSQGQVGSAEAGVHRRRRGQPIDPPQAARAVHDQGVSLAQNSACGLLRPLVRNRKRRYLIRMDHWRNKVALVTGGSSGLGRVIADAFAAAGAKVAIVGLEADAVRRTAGEMQAAGRDVLGLQADITRQEDVDRLFAATLERFGRLDVLVNNAGRSMRGKLLDTTPEQFRDLMELNLIALVRCTRAAVPHLLKQRGHVVNIGSLAAKSAVRWVGAYPATQTCRGGLQPAVAARARPARAARAVGLPRSDPPQRRPALSAGRLGGPARKRPRSGRRRSSARRSPGAARPRDFACVRAASPRVGRFPPAPASSSPWLNSGQASATGYCGVRRADRRLSAGRRMV